MSGAVYVGSILNRPGVKIGRSKSPEKRAKEYGRIAGAPFTLLHSEVVADDKAVENAAHWELREKHIRHEWFDATIDEAKAAIAVAVEKVANGVLPPSRIGIRSRFAKGPLDPQFEKSHLSGKTTDFVQLVISAAELKALDAWREKTGIWSRSAAIRRLIAEGIKRKP